MTILVVMMRFSDWLIRNARLNGAALLAAALGYLGFRMVGPGLVLIALSLMCLFFVLRFRHRRVED